MVDAQEFERWWRQAQHNLASAERDTAAGDFAWACFKAQQAAEMAVKGLLLGLGQPAHGHSVLALVRRLEALSVTVPGSIKESAQRLDRLYIPPRYPNAHPTGSPFEFYNAADAQQALTDARQVMDFVQRTFRDAQMVARA